MFKCYKKISKSCGNFRWKSSKIIIKKKKFYESENLSLDSSKAFKFLRWKTHLSDVQALKMTFHWFKNFYNKSAKKNIIKFTFQQIDHFKNKTNF